MTMRIIPSSILILAFVAALASAAPDEANGTVTAVISGDVFEIAIIKADPRTGSGVETVRLADLSIHPAESAGGKAAKEFAEALLANRTVSLDIDNNSEDGRDPAGRLLSVVYLVDPDGEVNLTCSLNRILVDAGHAEVDDFEDDEFDPDDWWSQDGQLSEDGKIRVVINEVESNPPEGDEDNEWLELYNDGFDDVDIGNWTLTAASGSVISIEPGTVLPSLEFLVVTADGYWLRNSDELVILRDETGQEVDRTPALDDGDNDDNSWSRYPDGGEEWFFIEASPDGPAPSLEDSETIAYWMTRMKMTTGSDGPTNATLSARGTSPTSSNRDLKALVSLESNRSDFTRSPAPSPSPAPSRPPRLGRGI